MFIGFISIKNEIIETVKIDVEESAVATRIFSGYVYDNYNRELGSESAYYYEGYLRDLKGMRDISSLEAKECVIR